MGIDFQRCLRFLFQPDPVSFLLQLRGNRQMSDQPLAALFLPGGFQLGNVFLDLLLVGGPRSEPQGSPQVFKGHRVILQRMIGLRASQVRLGPPGRELRCLVELAYSVRVFSAGGVLLT
jgi:hypothetical protein